MVGMLLLVEKLSQKAVTQNSTLKALLKPCRYWGFLSEGQLFSYNQKVQFKICINTFRLNL